MIMKNYTFPRWNDLPEIELYMDQVITYMNDKLKDTYFYDEKFITKSMINNYVKTGIVHPPVKALYKKSFSILFSFNHSKKMLFYATNHIFTSYLYKYERFNN